MNCPIHQTNVLLLVQFLVNVEKLNILLQKALNLEVYLVPHQTTFIELFY